MIENTADRDPLLHLLGASGGSDRYITEMESAGQRQLVHSDRLPTKILGSTVEDFEALGFTLGGPDASDPIFRTATLPDGWRREASDHDMWSYIVDGSGRRRVAVFYKAAFYDRSAHMRLQSPESDIFRLLYGEINELPVDDWTTREVWLELLRAEIGRLEESAEENDRYGLAESAGRDRANAVRLSDILAGFEAGQ